MLLSKVSSCLSSLMEIVFVHLKGGVLTPDICQEWAFHLGRSLSHIMCKAEVQGISGRGLSVADGGIPLGGNPLYLLLLFILHIRLSLDARN